MVPLEFVHFISVLYKIKVCENSKDLQLCKVYLWGKHIILKSKQQLYNYMLLEVIDVDMNLKYGKN